MPAERVEDESYVDHLFKVATGWLGWTPAVAWATPVPELLLALDGRLEWAKMTTSAPMGIGPPAAAPAAAPAPRTKEARDQVAAKLRGAFLGRG